MRDVDLIPGATSTLRARLYAKVVRTTRRGCWQWAGKHTISRGGARRPAIKVGWQVEVMNVARVLLVLRDRTPLAERAGLHAGHTCGNPWCVNVRHLRWQTPEENARTREEHRRRRQFDKAVNEVLDGESAAAQ